MRKLLPAVAAVVAIALSAGVPAFAKGHGGHVHGAHLRGGHHLARVHRSRFADRDDHVPPGWSHGRKVGWDGHDMPPGLYRH